MFPARSSNTGQLTVREWSNGGQILVKRQSHRGFSSPHTHGGRPPCDEVKYWSNTGQSRSKLVEKLAKPLSTRTAKRDKKSIGKTVKVVEYWSNTGQNTCDGDCDEDDGPSGARKDTRKVRGRPRDW